MDTKNIKEHVDKTNIEEYVDKTKRDFIKKFGKYAATAPLGMYLLMGPGSSKAQASGSCTCTCPPIIGKNISFGSLERKIKKPEIKFRFKPIRRHKLDK